MLFVTYSVTYPFKFIEVYKASNKATDMIPMYSILFVLSFINNEFEQGLCLLRNYKTTDENGELKISQDKVEILVD